MNKIDRATAATTSDEVDTNDQKSKKYDSDPTFDIKFETDHVEHLDSAQRLDDNELLFVSFISKYRCGGPKGAYLDSVSIRTRTWYARKPRTK
jgi:hypothetical protein